MVYQQRKLDLLEKLPKKMPDEKPQFRDVTEIKYKFPQRKQIFYERLKDDQSLWENWKQAWKEVRVEGPPEVSVPGTITNLWRKIKQAEWLTGSSQYLIYYVNLYHKAVQELVEGHRQVTTNHKTELKDGKTVEEKLKKVIFIQFEESLKNKVDKQLENY